MKALLIALALLALYAVPVAAQGDMNCDDFESQAQAQQYFRENGGSSTNNVDDLDRNGNGVACENNTDYTNPATDLRPAYGNADDGADTTDGDDTSDGVDTADGDDTDDGTGDTGTDDGMDDSMDDGSDDGSDDGMDDGSADDATDDGTDDGDDGEQPTMPDTGAGGITTGASVPWGTMGLAASGLLAAGYTVLRRR